MISARNALRQAEGLPTLPTIVAQLAKMLNDPNTGAADFEKIIRPDPALTTNLLKLANSPFFGIRREVSSVRQAVALLGAKRVFDLAASASFVKVLPPKIPGYEVESGAFWTHCIAVASMAENLALATGQKAPDMIFTVGLLHDIGKLAIGSLLVSGKEELMKGIWESGKELSKAEYDILGTDHTEVGELMVEEWNLPPLVGEVARWHHNPSEAPEDCNIQAIDLVHLADGLAHSMGFGADVGELSRRFEGKPSTRLGLKVQDMELVVVETVAQINEMGGALSSSQGGQA